MITIEWSKVNESISTRKKCFSHHGINIANQNLSISHLIWFWPGINLLVLFFKNFQLEIQKRGKDVFSLLKNSFENIIIIITTCDFDDLILEKNLFQVFPWVVFVWCNMKHLCVFFAKSMPVSRFSRFKFLFLCS